MTFQEKFCVCYPSYARAFDFDMVEGEAAALEEKGRVLIPASMAHRFFGDHPAVGQVRICLQRALRNGRRGIRGASLFPGAGYKPRLTSLSGSEALFSSNLTLEILDRIKTEWFI